MPKITFRAEVFQEGNLYVGLFPELNISSFGKTIEEARRSLHEAVEAFIEECEAMGTLEDVMTEAGFVKEHDTCLQPHKGPVVCQGQICCPRLPVARVDRYKAEAGAASVTKKGL